MAQYLVTSSVCHYYIILFRLTSSYRESILSEDLFEYMIMIAASTVDVYNDKFFMISKGMLSIQQFIESEQAPE